MSGVKAYLLSLPERFVRSTLGLGAGVTRELADVAIPAGIRRSRLYQNLVDATLRFLIEQVGGVEGVYRDGDRFLKTSSPGARPATPSKPSASSRFAPRPSGSLPRWPTSAAWDGT